MSIFDNLNLFSFSQDYVESALDLILKIFKNKKNDNEEFMMDICKNEEFYKASIKILKIHQCNMKIMSKILSLIFYIKTDKYLSLISFNYLKNIFNIYKINGFDLIHEVILYLLKIIIINKINDFHKLNPIKPKIKHNSLSVKKIISNNFQKLKGLSFSDSKNNSFNSSLNNIENSKDELNNNSKIKRTKTLHNLRHDKDLLINKKLNKNNSTTKLINTIKKPQIMNSYNDNMNDADKNIDYGNNYQKDRYIADINGGLFSVEDFIDVLGIFSPALNLIKNKIFHVDVNLNNKIFYKFINNLEIISYLVVTLATKKDNKENLKNLISCKFVENIVSIIKIYIEKNIYNDIQKHLNNKQFMIINYKIFIVKKLYYIFKIIDIIKEQYPILKVNK